MMIIESLFPLASNPPPSDDFWYTDLNYSPSLNQDAVTADNALTVTAVLAAVRVLAETIAQLPLHLMRLEGRSKYPAVNHPLYDLLHRQPNHWQTSFEFREMMQGHLALRGNAYAHIRSGPRGAVDQLVPLHPGRMEVFRLENERIGYLYRDNQGKRYRFTQDEIFHLRGLSGDGLVGLSPITLGRRAVELARENEKHGVRFYQNMAKPGGLLKMPEGRSLTPERHGLLKKSWREAHSGSDLYSVAILEDGMEWQQVGISNEDGQWLQSREYQVTEIARMFRVPPHLIADLSRSTYSNIEHQGLEFVIHTMLPWIVRWEMAIWRDLITAQQYYYPKFSIEGLLRGDSAARAQFFKELWYLGVLTINEIREKEDLNPVENGDTRFVPLNMIPLDQADSAIEEAAAEFDASMPRRPSAKAQPRHSGQSGNPETAAANKRQKSRNPERAKLQPNYSGWIADAAQRLAAAETRELAKRAEKASKDRPRFDRWATEHWSTKHFDYLQKTIDPICTAVSGCGAADVNSVAIASQLTHQTIAELTNLDNDPCVILADWQTDRAEYLHTFLKESFVNEPKRH